MHSSQTEQSSMLASIHEQCEMHRKAAFYRRKAAMSYIKVADVDITQVNKEIIFSVATYFIKKSKSSGIRWVSVEFENLVSFWKLIFLWSNLTVLKPCSQWHVTNDLLRNPYFNPFSTSVSLLCPLSETLVEYGLINRVSDSTSWERTGGVQTKLSLT